MGSSSESSEGKPSRNLRTGPLRILELAFLYTYAVGFVVAVVNKSVNISAEYGTGSKAGWLWGLKEGWIPKQRIDLSDAQWRNFRGNIIILSGVMALFTLAGQTLRSVFRLGTLGMSWFWFVISLVYIAYLHGTSSLFIVAIALGNFLLVKFVGGSSLLPAALWAYNIFFLLSNRIYSGYKFASFGEQFAFMDNHRGIMRWHISFNMVMLRMVSFGLDLHWARVSRRSTIDWEKHNKSCKFCQSGSSCYLARQELPIESDAYNVVTYFSYLLFAPLYVAGPIISYNAFTSQLNAPQRTLTNGQVATYGLRWLACLMLMEVMTQYCYYNSLAISGVWQMLSPVEIFVVGYGVLNFMWLKFLLIWRFFRFWALVAGVEAPENMLRCVNNCYDLEGFWKSWHSSYNRWLVRYLYIPLGGSKWRILNVWLIFTFVALWHDLEWKLLSWAWVTCLLWGPELTVKYIMQRKQMQGFRNSPMYEDCCAVAGALNMAGIMTANLVGFVVGPSGMRLLASLLITTQNIPLLLGIFATFFVGCKIMFHVREVASRSLDKIGSD
ncbi:unnamed protein product [Calypogeia fissa]